MRAIAISLLFIALASMEARCEEPGKAICDKIRSMDNPSFNPEADAYLRGLSQEQMFQAARYYAELAEKNLPQDRWAGAAWTISLVFRYYGSERYYLTDDKLNTFLKCIGNEKENPVLRESLLRILNGFYANHLTETQQTQWRKHLFTLFLDKAAPDRLRTEACSELVLSIVDRYRTAIYGDKNVAALRADREKWENLMRADREEWENLNKLVSQGTVQITSETRVSLRNLRGEIEAVKSALLKEAGETSAPEKLSKETSVSLKRLAELLVPPVP